jgi:hypothetical protein
VEIRWNRQNSTYGSVNTGFSAQRIINEVSHPTTYYPPFMITFDEIDIDATQPKWEIQGVSDRGENSQGYGATCQLAVVKRGREISGMPLEPRH